MDVDYLILEYTSDVYEFTNLFQMYLNHYLCDELVHSELFGVIVFVFFPRYFGLV